MIIESVRKLLKVEWIKQFIKYVIAGLICVGIDAIIYSTLYTFGVSMNVAKLVGITTSVVCAYFINTIWSFRNKISLKSAIKFATVYTTSIICNVYINAIVYKEFSSTSLELYAIYIAFLIATCFSVVIDFLGLKFWIYKK